MEAQELVTRIRAANDERQVIISLTKAGDAMRKQAIDVPESVLCATECSAAEAIAMKDELGVLRSRLMKNTAD